MPRLSPVAMLPTAVRHRVWSYEESFRSLLGKDQMGFPRRPTPTARVTLVRPRAPGVSRAQDRVPPSVHAGVAGPGVSALALATSHFGIELEASDRASTALMLRRASKETWPLVAMSGRSGTPRAAELLAYLRTGGTVFIPELTAEDDGWLQALAGEIQVDLPRCRRLSRPATNLIFSGSRPDIAGEIAGLRIENREGASFLETTAGGECLAWFEVGADTPAAMIEVVAHGGRLVLTVGPAPPPGSLGELFQPEQALSVLPALMLVRDVYGEAAWRQQFAMANFTIDDPVLRQGFLGLDYKQALEAARIDNFHLTVATVPGELSLADPATIRLLAGNHDRVTACFHGNDHAGYEFFTAENGRSRFRDRPLRAQRAALRQAVARSVAFAEYTGHTLDRVMVFPHGLGPAALLGELGKLGFVASSNWLDRYPLARPRPSDPDLGMRPADVAWDGFPLLWRRPLDDETSAFDLFVGRPVLHFTHRREAGVNFEPLRALAGRINEAALEKVHWLGLDQIARHAYVQRRRPRQRDWDVLMTANLACLHNCDADTRRYHVLRPNLPDGAWLEARGVTGSGAELELEVAPGETVIVRVDGAEVGQLPDPLAGRPCSLTHEVAS